MLHHQLLQRKYIFEVVRQGGEVVMRHIHADQVGALPYLLIWIEGIYKAAEKEDSEKELV
jgi:hypothetical protein